MKNKFLQILAISLCLIAAACTFVGCGGADDGGGGGHVHVFDKQVVEDETFKEEATCEHGDLYYYSCECGEIGTATFEDGRALEHTFDQNVEKDEYLVNEGDCTTNATYHYSCKCGLASTEMFVSDEGIDHNFVDGECTTCGEPETDNSGDEPEE